MDFDSLEYLKIEIRERVATVTLNDPERRNTLSVGLCADLTKAFDQLESREDVGAVIITGAPPSFCAGADLTQLGDSQAEGLAQIYAGFLRVANSTLPTIAAVNGAAVGAGMNLALAADIRLAAHGARFDTRFVDLGIHPGGGHTWMLQRIVGPQTAAAMVLFGQPVDGATAERLGLVWKSYESHELLDAAITIAKRAASGPPQLVKLVKQTMADVVDIADHGRAVARELEPQLWSINQPAFAERLAELKAKISSASS